MATELEELLGFLSSPSPQVKKVAVNIVRGLTGSEDGLQSLANFAEAALPPLSHLLGENKVSGTIRNCCFEAESQLQNLLLASEFLWPALLLPVSGSKIYSKQDTSKMPPELGTALSVEREGIRDPEIRVQALEAIYLLSLQDAGQRALWSINGPRILQVGYEEEEDPKVMEAYEQIGSLLVQSSGGAGEPVSETTK